MAKVIGHKKTLRSVTSQLVNTVELLLSLTKTKLEKQLNIMNIVFRMLLVLNVEKMSHLTSIRTDSKRLSKRQNLNGFPSKTESQQKKAGICASWMI